MVTHPQSLTVKTSLRVTQSRLAGGESLAKLSKESWKVFEFNMNKAFGLVMLQYYGDDLVRTGGKESVGKLMDFTGQMFKAFGITEYDNLQDMIEKEIAPLIEKELGPKLEAKLRMIPQEQLEKAGKEWLEKNKDNIKQFERIVRQLLLAIENVLLEQAIVTAVTALEVYVHDVTVEAVARNVFMQKRFTSQLHAKLDYRTVLNSNRDLGLSLGRVAAGSYDYYNSKSLGRHMSVLLGRRNPLTRRNDISRFETILSYRHLIVHRAGIVDRVFAVKTGYKGRQGKPVRLTRQFVNQTLDFIQNIGRSIQDGLSCQRA
jgi:hypothetical protein